MKAGIITLWFALFLIISGRAQSTFEQGSITINGGLGLGLPSYYGNIAGFGIPLHAHLDYGFSDYISLGPQVGFAHYTYDYFWDQYDYSYTYTRIGGRAAFHYLPILTETGWFEIEESKYDFYVLLNTGIEMVSFSSDLPSSAIRDKKDTRFYIGPSLGFRYYFNPRIGTYLETGSGQNAWALFGITLQLK